MTVFGEDSFAIPVQRPLLEVTGRHSLVFGQVIIVKAEVLSAENQTLVIVASHCILTSDLERFCETNLTQRKAGRKYLCQIYLGKRRKYCAKASAKAVHLVPIYLTILGESVQQGTSPAVSQVTSRNSL